jgi:membrane-bound metal-dependent hydrolase YbcI (DUF457 family)
MRGQTHVVTGATTGAITTTTLAVFGTPYGVALLAGALTAYAALLPDLDHHSSTVTYSLGPVTILLSWVIRGAPVGLGPLDGYLLPWTRCEHRGFTHRPEGWLTFAVLFGVGLGLLVGYPVAWGLAVFLGCATHTWGDCRTLAGVSLRRDAEPTRIGQPFRVERGDYDAHGYLSEEARLRRFLYVPVAVASWVAALWVAWRFGLMLPVGA